RLLLNLTRERQDADSQLARLADRLSRAEGRLAEVGGALRDGELLRVRQDEALGAARSTLATLETEQESAREGRVHWQVHEAHVAARVRATNDRLDRATQTIALTQQAAESLLSEIANLERESGTLGVQQAEWLEQRKERLATLGELEAAAAAAEVTLTEATAG